jgi:inhibitor of cysteine peptidase
MIELDERANGTRVDVQRGHPVGLRLTENPTSGYRWRLDADGAPALTVVHDRYEPPPRGTAGAPGHHAWRFFAAAVGSAEVRLSYSRAGGAAARTLAFTVEVRA